MQISGDTISPTKRSRTIYVVVTVVLVAVIASYMFYEYKFLRLIRIFDRTNDWLFWPSSRRTDIAIYVIADSQTAPNGDLRTRFWEPRMYRSGQNFTVKYVADMEMPNVGKVPWIVPAVCEDGKSQCDPGYCYRNIESWADFVNTQRHKPWYFKAFQDTYVNVENLLKWVKWLEGRVDPMTVPYFAYTIDEENGQATPDGLTGWLISNAALRALFDHAQHFAIGCSSRGEDVGMAEMMHNMQLEVDQYVSQYFIAEWPKDVEKVIGEGDREGIKACPARQYRTEERVDAPFDDVQGLIATRMQDKDMAKVVELVEKCNDVDDLKIGWRSKMDPVFCLA